MKDDKEYPEEGSAALSDKTDQHELSEEAHKEAHNEHEGGFAEAILEEFSIEGNINRLHKLTKLPENVVTYIFAAINIILGVLCIVITSYVAEYLPYLVGGTMILLGIGRLISALRHHEHRQAKINHAVTSIIVLALGAMIIFQHMQPDNDSAITFISIVWGILGLFEGGHLLNQAFTRISNSERYIFQLTKGILELVVAFLLLYNPVSHETHHLHIIVFGCNLILDAVVAIPQVKAFFAAK